MEEGKGMVHKKQTIRNKYLFYRDSLSFGERRAKSKKILERLKEEKSFQEAEIVLVYMDYRSEVMTTELVEELLRPESGKRVFAPLVEGMDIDFYEITSLDDLHAGYQSIREPEGRQETQFTKELMEGKKCLLTLPGSVYDRQLYRMGYGKGFYDRFLEKYPAVTKAGLAFSCQIVPFDLPAEPHDIKMDMIITENEVIRG